MGRPPVIPAERKTRIVLSVLAGEMSIAEAARREKVSEQSIGRWKADFLEAGKTALAAGRSGPSTREEQLEAQVEESRALHLRVATLADVVAQLLLPAAQQDEDLTMQALRSYRDRSL